MLIFLVQKQVENCRPVITETLLNIYFLLRKHMALSNEDIQILHQNEVKVVTELLQIYTELELNNIFGGNLSYFCIFINKKGNGQEGKQNIVQYYRTKDVRID